MLFGFKTQVTLAALGYAIFGVGVEIAGITVSKIIVKWFKGKEMALAMGLEMATARIGTTLAMVMTVPLADFFGYTDEGGAFPYQYSCSYFVLSHNVVCRYNRLLHLYFLR